MVNELKEACIGDMGLVKFTMSKVKSTSYVARNGGSLHWQAPELFESDDVDFDRETDAYAFAMTVFEVCIRCWHLRRV